MNTKELKNRFSGAIVGFAVGDALGMPAQFLSRDQILRYYGKPISNFLKAHDGHASDFYSRFYTDDTQMMLVTAESLIEQRKMDPARQAEAILSWYSNTIPHRTPARAICELANISPPVDHGQKAESSAADVTQLDACLLSAFFIMRIRKLWFERHWKPVPSHIPNLVPSRSSCRCLFSRQIVQITEKCSAGDQVLETADRIASIDSDMAAMLRWITKLCIFLQKKRCLKLAPVPMQLKLSSSSLLLPEISAAIFQCHIDCSQWRGCLRLDCGLCRSFVEQP